MYPVAYWIAFHGGRHKSTLLLLVLLPFFVSFVIRILTWQFILADQGIVLGTLKDIGLLPRASTSSRPRAAVIAGLTYDALPFMALPIYVALENIDRSHDRGGGGPLREPLRAVPAGSSCRCRRRASTRGSCWSRSPTSATT